MKDKSRKTLIKLLLSVGFLLAVIAVAKSNEKHKEYGSFFSDLEDEE